MSNTHFSVSLEELLEAGCHFGHQARRWNPKMKSFIFAERDGVHIFDLVKTQSQLDQACEKVFEYAKGGKKVVFVGTKHQAQSIVSEQASQAGANFLTTRWLGGLITNWEQVGKSVRKLEKRKTEKAEGKYAIYTKKENVLIDKEIERLERFFGGVADLRNIPDMLIVVDINKDIVAIKEAKAKGVFVIAIADSNTDPDLVDIAIPANDDAVGSITLIISTLAKAFKEGHEMLAKEQASKAQKTVVAPQETK